MTLGDLLLENRIVFLGSSPETGGNPAITDYLANITIRSCCSCSTRTAPRTSTSTSTAPAAR